MLKWALVFLIIAVIAGIFGLTDVEAASATIAQWLFGIFVVLFLGALIIGTRLRSRWLLRLLRRLRRLLLEGSASGRRPWRLGPRRRENLQLS
jgi:uncharacterized membrane protein YtjA (UPF0391 family)